MKREQVKEGAREDGEGEGEEDGKGEGAGEGGAREQVKEMEKAMTRRVAMSPGASQPTLVLGRQTSNCHVGQDYAGRLSIYLTGPKSGAPPAAWS
jgi:hypothetical protein